MPVLASSDVSLLDVIELDTGYTTIVDEYYRPVAPQVVLDGARAGMVAYLRGRGIADPQVSLMRAHPDGRGVVPAIEGQLGRVIERYGAQIDVRDLVYGALRGELAALHDPYTVFFTKRELGGFTAALDGRSFGGIGVVVAADPQQRYIADEVFDGGPAAKAGLAAGDHIVAVDGEAVDGLASDAVSALLRGTIGSRVVLDVDSPHAAGTRRLTIVRAAITPPDVSARLLPGDIGYVALRAFGPDAGAQVHSALARLHARGARAIVFDLRGNRGGYESAAVRVASAFISDGTIVVTQTNHGHRVATVADRSALAALPLAVLVDRDSASGSELVTGAIADHHAGIVIGTRTFGKGVEQTMFPLPDGSAMKVTTARYFTPNGRDIDGIGIEPDLVVDEPPGSVRGVPGNDPQLDAALQRFAQAPATTAPLAPRMAATSAPVTNATSAP
jgi:carboxyl-terminal processing protease